MCSHITCYFAPFNHLCKTTVSVRVQVELCLILDPQYPVTCHILLIPAEGCEILALQLVGYKHDHPWYRNGKPVL